MSSSISPVESGDWRELVNAHLTLLTWQHTCYTGNQGAPGMETNFSNRLQATLLAVATVGLVLLAIWNFRQETHFLEPDDGIWWSEAQGGSGLKAQKVLDASPGYRAGIKTNDLLT